MYGGEENMTLVNNTNTYSGIYSSLSKTQNWNFDNELDIAWMNNLMNDYLINEWINELTN